jgi:hypothetical protein
VGGSSWYQRGMLSGMVEENIDSKLLLVMSCDNEFNNIII